MSILSWLKRATIGNATAEFMEQPLEFAAGEEEFRGLNMRSALDAHVQWTHRLEAIINGTSSERLEVGQVASDCNCVLGKWIHGYAKQHFSELEDYRELKRVHADFHLTAGQVLNDLQHGQNTEAKDRLKQVRFKSGNVQLSLVRLYSRVLGE